MKRLSIIMFLLFTFTVNIVHANEFITGRFAEKISERVVMDIYSNQNDNEYQIFITWREDNLSQKDVYRFNCK